VKRLPSRRFPALSAAVLTKAEVTYDLSVKTGLPSRHTLLFLPEIFYCRQGYERTGDPRQAQESGYHPLCSVLTAVIVNFIPEKRFVIKGADHPFKKQPADQQDQADTQYDNHSAAFDFFRRSFLGIRLCKFPLVITHIFQNASSVAANCISILIVADQTFRSGFPDTVFFAELNVAHIGTFQDKAIIPPPFPFCVMVN
jgi:hypothetical protein